jgi:uncharacterized protein (TIGR02186 family)
MGVRLLGWVMAIVAGASLTGGAAAQSEDPLVADLSNHLVAITTGFAGAKVLLFGAVEGEGDIIVVVRGPAEPEIVRRKERVLGVWINRGQAVIDDAPVYYRIAASRPLASIASPPELDRHQIGVDRLDLDVRSKDKSATAEDYRAALLRLKESAHLYVAQPGLVNFISGRLFRTEMDFPANVPTGTYTVEVFLLRGGDVVSAQTTPLIISKTGLGAEIFDFANRQAAVYGVLAIALSALAGWLGAAVFRRG